MRSAVLLSLVISVLAGPACWALDPNNVAVQELARDQWRKEIRVPDILDMKTLKCDLHMHTIFSDGDVWPTVRVDEAWRQGLDVIAITDHIEGHPDKEHVGGKHNPAYEIALPRARELDILLVHAAEMSRDMPPGHFNALFVKDANALDKKDFMKAVKEAVGQGGFILWNHPGWKSQQPEKTLWWDDHEELYKKGWLNGIEVFNSNEWYPIALEWCVTKNVTVLADSDMHDVVSEAYDLSQRNRPMTLVFARERSLDAVREALFAGRTAAWFGDQLAGKKEYLEALLKESITVHPPHFIDDKGRRYIEITNRSDIPFALQGEDAAWKDSVRLPSCGTNMIRITGEPASIKVKVTNLHVGLDQDLVTQIPIPAGK